MPFKPQQALLPGVRQGGTLLRIALAVCWDAGCWIVIILTSAPSPRPCVCSGLLKNRYLLIACVSVCICALWKCIKQKCAKPLGKADIYHGQKFLSYLISQLIYQGTQQFIRIIEIEDQRHSGISFPITLEETVFNKKTNPVTNIDHLKSRFLVCITENFEKPFQTLPSW